MHIQIPRKTYGRVDLASANRLFRAFGAKLEKLVFDPCIHLQHTPPTIEGSMALLIIDSRDESKPSPIRGRTEVRPRDLDAGVAA